MTVDIEHENGVEAACEFAERHLLGHSLQRKAVFSEFLDIHFPFIYEAAIQSLSWQVRCGWWHAPTFPAMIPLYDAR